MQIINTVKAQPHQALIDLAIQEGGSVETLFELAALNNLGITDDLTVGKDYLKPTVYDARITKVFQGIMKPASSTPVSEDWVAVLETGIDYWFIENDFIVS